MTKLNRYARTPLRIYRASTMKTFLENLNSIETLIRKVRKYDVDFLPLELQEKIKGIDEYEQTHESEQLLYKSLQSWQSKWRQAYDNQFPNHLVVPIHKGLTPMQTLILGMLEANVRTLPMMASMTGRSRQTLFNAMKPLVSNGLVFRVSTSMHFEASWNKKDAKKWAKEYIASNSNINGVIPPAVNYNFDMVAANFTRVMRKNDGWKKVDKHPDD